VREPLPDSRLHASVCCYLRFSPVSGKSLQNRTARWVITKRAVSIVLQFLLGANPVRPEWIESRFHIRFDF
jgi:hypothetical protein